MANDRVAKCASSSLHTPWPGQRAYGYRLPRCALHDRNPDVREHAAFTLGQIRSETAVDGLIGALDDGVAKVRFHAVQSLGYTGGARANLGLVKFLSDADDELWAKTLHILAENGDSTVLPHLEKMKDRAPSDQLQRLVQWAVRKIRERERDRQSQLDAEPASYEFECPNCGSALKAKHSAIGKPVTCRDCKQKIKIPSRKALDAPANTTGWSPELERSTAQEAKRPLTGELEALAERAGRLGHEYSDIGDAKWEEMKSIGRKLNARGGFPLMLLVCLRARELGGRHTSVSAAWDGIGKWQN